ERPSVQPQRCLLGIRQRAGVDHVVLDRGEGGAATHMGGDVRLEVLERGHQRPPRFSVSRPGPLSGRGHSTFGSLQGSARGSSPCVRSAIPGPCSVAATGSTEAMPTAMSRAAPPGSSPRRGDASTQGGRLAGPDPPPLGGTTSDGPQGAHSNRVPNRVPDSAKRPRLSHTRLNRLARPRAKTPANRPIIIRVSGVRVPPPALEKTRKC